MQTFRAGGAGAGLLLASEAGSTAKALGIGRASVYREMEAGSIASFG